MQLRQHVRLFACRADESVSVMRVKWIGLTAVAIIAATIVGYKVHVSSRQEATVTASLPRVVLVADLSEANDHHDACAEIIHLVQAVHDHGIAVQELNPGSKSDLLSRYHVLTIPTVLILDREGKVVARYQGESRETVKALRAGLEQLR